MHLREGKAASVRKFEGSVDGELYGDLYGDVISLTTDFYMIILQWQPHPCIIKVHCFNISFNEIICRMVSIH